MYVSGWDKTFYFVGTLRAYQIFRLRMRGMMDEDYVIDNRNIRKVITVTNISFDKSSLYLRNSN